MKGKIHKMFNDKQVIREVEILMELKSGSLKIIPLREGNTVQIVKTTRGRKNKPKKGVRL